MAYASSISVASCRLVTLYASLQRVHIDHALAGLECKGFGPASGVDHEIETASLGGFFRNQEFVQFGQIGERIAKVLAEKF